MRLCRFGEPGNERPAIVDSRGQPRDASSLRRDFTPDDLSPDGLAALARIDITGLPSIPDNSRLGVPIVGTTKIVCIGLNYADHAAESGMAAPSEPIIFLKPTTALCGPNDQTIRPAHSTKLDYEIELGVVIGTTARSVSEADALDYVAGYCVVNDVSERAFQMQSGQWDKGKGCDTFAPVGPWLVTKDEIPNPQALAMRLDVNGVRRQTGNTSTMIFGVKALVSYASRYMTLLPGDIIATGTPPGVAMGMKPDPVWLKIGDRVDLEIEGLGKQTQQIIEAAM